MVCLSLLYLCLRDRRIFYSKWAVFKDYIIGTVLKEPWKKPSYMNENCCTKLCFCCDEGNHMIRYCCFALQEQFNRHSSFKNLCFSINFKRFFIQRNYFDRKVTSNEKQSKLDSGMIMIKGIAFNDLSLKVKFIPGKVDVNMHNKIFIIIILQHISQNKMNT